MIAIYLATEAAGVCPSATAVIEYGRKIGLRFSNPDGFGWLQPFVAAAKTRKIAELRGAMGSVAEQPGADGSDPECTIKEGGATGSVAEQPGADGSEPEHRGAPTRARSKEFLVSSNSDSLRSSAMAFGEWPMDTERLRALALLFLDAFGNTRGDEAVKRHVGPYMNGLAKFRSRRGVSIAIAWACCEQARDANGGAPLFGPKIEKAIDYLLPEPKYGGRPADIAKPAMVQREIDALREAEERDARELAARYGT